MGVILPVVPRRRARPGAGANALTVRGIIARSRAERRSDSIEPRERTLHGNLRSELLVCLEVTLDWSTFGFCKWLQGFLIMKFI